MQFVHPEILWALFALAIPVIIHLFHFRRFKKVYFTNVRFLKEIKEEKSTRRKLRNLLVLLCRLLALAFIIFAFAQPFISKDSTAKKGISNVSLFVDNSFSMTAASEDVPLLDKAKRKAEEIISAYAETDRFQVFSHELKGSQQRWISRENTVQALEEIELNPEVNMLGTVYNRQAQSFPDEGNNLVYFISDFQKSICDLPETIDSSIELNLVPLQSVRENNISIDSAWFESVVPALNQNNKLLLRITNHGTDDQKDLRISMNHNKQVRPVGTIDVEAGQSKTDTVNLLVNEAGWQRVQLRIEDYPVQFDDSYYLAFNVKPSVKVLSISQSDTEKYFDAVFRSLNNFELERAGTNSIPYGRLNEFDLVILADLENISSGLASQMAEYIENGGNVLLFPSQNAVLDSYNSFLSSLSAPGFADWKERQAQVYRINTAEFIFSNVFTDISNNLKLPETRGSYTQAGAANRPGEVLLSYRDGQPYISKYSRGKGQLLVSMAPVNRKFNDLVINAEVFVPLLYKAAFASSQKDKLSYVIGRDNSLRINDTGNADEMIFRITGNDEFIPGQTSLGNRTLLNFNNMITEAGYYDVTLDGQLVQTIAMNYDRLESRLDFFGPAELKEKYGPYANIIDNPLNANLGAVIKEKDKGITFWKWCLILALIFLAAEILLLRLWKI